jgi:hypothetical protein
MRFRSGGHQTIGEATATRDKTPAALAVALQPHYVSWQTTSPYAHVSRLSEPAPPHLSHLAMKRNHRYADGLFNLPTTWPNAWQKQARKASKQLLVIQRIVFQHLCTS